MSDWSVGDLAVCVDDRNWDGTPIRELELGRVYTVVDVFVGCDSGNHQRDDVLALELAETRPSDVDGFESICFRKIRPDEQEACEPEFVTLLKRSKRKVSA